MDRGAAVAVGAYVRRRAGAFRDGDALRIAFDYLDYDGDPAPLHHVALFHAFRPDNLLAPTTVERQLHTPGSMLAVVFERLTPAEVLAIKDMVTAVEYRHVPTGTLAVLAQRLGTVWASPST